MFLFSTASQACEMQLFGKCSQFCTMDASTYGYSCSCAEGYILQQDNLTCLAFGKSYEVCIRSEMCNDNAVGTVIVNGPFVNTYTYTLYVC